MMQVKKNVDGRRGKRGCTHGWDGWENASQQDFWDYSALGYIERGGVSLGDRWATAE